MKQEQVFSLIRHVLSAVGGILIAKGVLSEGIVLELSGSILAIVAMVWSIRAKTLTITQTEGVVRQVLSTLGMFVTFISPEFITEAVGIVIALLPAILGQTAKLKPIAE